MGINSLNPFFVDVKKELIVYNSILLGELDKTRPSFLLYSDSAEPKHLFYYLSNHWVGENGRLGNFLECLEEELTVPAYSG